MLLELRLRNVAVIESVTLPLTTGLNVLTGETGAGKSLIVGALGLLLGERAGADRIRAGADRAVVEATFDARGDAALRAWLDEHGIEPAEDLLILKREVSASGRSRAWVNGSPVTIMLLRALGARLVAVHGQHEAQELLAPAAQRTLLDAYGEAEDDARVVAACHARLGEARAARAQLEQRRREVEQRADYLRFVLAEIDDARLQPGEDVALESEHRRLAHAEELRRTAEGIVSTLRDEQGGVLDALPSVQRALQTLRRIDPSLERLQPVLDSAHYALEELARELEGYVDAVESDPGRLEVVDARRALLHQLTRKHGPTLHEVLATAERARAELALVDDIAAARTDADTAVREAERALTAAAASLSARRETAARRLGEAVTLLLPELGLPDGRFLVQLVALDEPSSHGAEQVQFQVALNAGAPAGALDRVASGGELARLMLALSTVLARLQAVPTLVFDEVDAGVGGGVAWQVGALMRRVAGHHQVLAISHLAQIAACAHHHVVVRKSRSEGYTTADTEALDGEARIAELARMLGGDADREVSRAHARELLDRGQAASALRAPTTATATSATRRQRRGKPG